jgi:hypothetical protein
MVEVLIDERGEFLPCVPVISASIHRLVRGLTDVVVFDGDRAVSTVAGAVEGR